MRVLFAHGRWGSAMPARLLHALAAGPMCSADPSLELAPFVDEVGATADVDEASSQQRGGMA